MGRLDFENDLRTALADFETSVTTPVVSGQLADWVEKAKRSWMEASTQTHYVVGHMHPRQFAEISEADPALLHQVELLRKEDGEIEQGRERLNQLVLQLAQHVAKFEPDEGRAQHHLTRLTEEGIAFVTRVRKQEVGVETWFAEAFHREHGGGD